MVWCLDTIDVVAFKLVIVEGAACKNMAEDIS